MPIHLQLDRRTCIHQRICCCRNAQLITVFPFLKSSQCLHCKYDRYFLCECCLTRVCSCYSRGLGCGIESRVVCNNLHILIVPPASTPILGCTLFSCINDCRRQNSIIWGSNHLMRGVMIARLCSRLKREAEADLLTDPVKSCVILAEHRLAQNPSLC